MKICIETRGNIHGFKNLIKKYKKLYEGEQRVQREKTQYRLSAVEFKNLVQAIAVARNLLKSNLNLLETSVTVVAAIRLGSSSTTSGSDIEEVVTVFESIMTRDMLNALNVKKK